MHAQDTPAPPRRGARPMPSLRGCQGGGGYGADPGCARKALEKRRVPIGLHEQHRVAPAHAAVTAPSPRRHHAVTAAGRGPTGP